MVARTRLLNSLPHTVESTLKTLGQNLRTARLRRNLTTSDVAEKIGVHRHVIGDAERGKPSTSIAVYAALLWTFGMVEQMGRLADPTGDEEGILKARARDRRHASSPKTLDNDF